MNSNFYCGGSLVTYHIAKRYPNFNIFKLILSILFEYTIIWPMFVIKKRKNTIWTNFYVLYNSDIYILNRKIK